MSTSSTKRRVALGLIAASLAAGFAAGSGTSPVSADPTQLSAYVGMGSDTTQAVMNAMAGFENGIDYQAINSGSATGFKHVISFDATVSQTASDTCVTPVINGPTFTRPSGSGAGRKALYQAQVGSNLTGAGNGGWTGSTFTLNNGTILPTCASLVNISGAVQYARSSAVGGNAGTDTVFVPFARDAITFAAYRPGGATPVTTLTHAQLVAVYAGSTRVTVTDPDNPAQQIPVIPCGIQTNSGTMQYWRDSVTNSAATEAAAVAECTPLPTDRMEENKGDLLKIKGDALAVTRGNNNFMVITGFSVSNWSAQANGVEPSYGFSSISLGSISDDAVTSGGVNLGAPTILNVGTGKYSPNPTFFNSTTGFGRDVYNVLRRSLVINSGTGLPLNNAYTSLFLDTNANPNGTAGAVNNSAANNSSAICRNGAVIENFGYAQITNCGDFSITRAWSTGNS